MTLFVVSLTIFALAMFGMALGVVFGRGAPSGSCGGPGGCERCMRSCERARGVRGPRRGGADR